MWRVSGHNIRRERQDFQIVQNKFQSKQGKRRDDRHSPPPPGDTCRDHAVRGAGRSAPRLVRIGVPTKTYWPTTVAEAAKAQKYFEKEGITAEITIYRGGAECFEALAAGAADLILDAPGLPAAGRKKGVMSKAVANAAMGNFGWHLMVLKQSPLELKDLNGKKVAITSAGSGSDGLALWTIQDKKINFTRVPVGGGGLVPNLLAGNVDAAVVYSPLSFQIAEIRRGPLR